MSAYVSNPSVPRARIETYPKRRKTNPVPLAWKEPARRPVSHSRTEVCYADFFVSVAARLVRAS